MELKLEVGKSYKTRGGWKATVVWKSDNQEKPFLAVHHLDLGDHGETHYQTGSRCSYSQDNFDLIAPWVDAPKEGTTEWVNTLPVGTRVRRADWNPESWVQKVSDGWLWNTGVVTNAPFSNEGTWSIVTRPIITDWPKWAKAVVKSYNGVWYWCDFIPSVQGYGWTCDDKCNFYQIHPSEVPDWKGDWKDSLVVREEANG